MLVKNIQLMDKEQKKGCGFEQYNTKTMGQQSGKLMSF